MVGAGSNQTIERIKEVSDILDIVGEAVTLRRAGRYYLGLCPFHAERTPSFYVDPQRQLFHCFGCGVGGDVIRFVMQHRGLSFPEAIEFLAERYNVSISKTLSESTSSKSTLLKYMTVAEEFYYQQLRYAPEGSVAREYLRKRQISDPIIEEQRLGYAPKSWDALVRHFQKNGLDLRKGAELGLFGVSVNRSGEKFYDRFRHRLIFPIRNSTGQVVAFGGRTLEDEPSSGNEPKYLNSPESELYRKRTILYQFHLAQEACRKEKRQVILVEGYMDALAFHRMGFYRTVATLGTALTPQQARLIKRIADEVVMVYDGDEAGRKAMIRNFPVLVNEGLKTSCIVLPEGMDPDDFFRHHLMEDFETLMESRKDMGEFVIQEITKGWDGSTSGKLKILSELFSYFEPLGQPVIQSEYLKLAGKALNLNEEVVLKQFKSWLASSKHRVSPPKTLHKRNSKDLVSSCEITSSLEEEILKIIMAYPHLVERVFSKDCWRFFIENLLEEENKEEVLSRPMYLIFRAIHEEWLEFSKNPWNKNWFCIDHICNRIGDAKAQGLFSRMAFECKFYDNEETALMLLNDYLGAFEKKIIKIRRERLIRELAEAEKKGDFESIKITLQKIQSLGGIGDHKELNVKAERGW
ncbi:MAG: DNA primase [Syntrophobacterales bacterium]|nr:DNA primase [Syntrophobacterales bacterium]